MASASIRLRIPFSDMPSALLVHLMDECSARDLKRLYETLLDELLHRDAERDAEREALIEPIEPIVDPELDALMPF